MMLPPLDVRVGKPLLEAGQVVLKHRPEQKVRRVEHHAAAANRHAYEPQGLSADVQKRATVGLLLE